MSHCTSSPIWRTAVFLVLIGLAVSTESAGQGCSFTAYVNLTLSEEMESMAIVAIGRRVTPAGAPEFGDKDPAKVLFVIDEIIKGDKHVRIGQQVTQMAFKSEQPGNLYLLMADDAQPRRWTTPLQITPRSREYLLKLGSLPQEGPDRLKFFYAYLEDQDEILARDAFDEFDDIAYTTLQKLQPLLQHDQLVQWIQNTDIPASRRRLYFRFLSICGSPRDLPLLEKIIRSTNRRERAGFDAAMDCYLVLRGTEGLPLIEELFLGNKKADYADTYSAIMALRWHAAERQVIPRERTLASLRLMLGRPELADLVIPDLMRWEDWSAVDQVFALFKDEKEGKQWVRVPAVQYLRRCPLKEAKEHLKACERLDPAAVHRANEAFINKKTP
jgi:hypothetical protein